MKYFIKTFGCQQNVADSERITATLKARGMVPAKDINEAKYIVINTCMVRESAENRVYGLVNNLRKLKIKNEKLKIILTGCLVGMAVRDKTGKMLALLKKRVPAVDEFLPIEEVGFDNAPLRTNRRHAWVPVTNGCNNFCTFCVVPFTRGREVSRPFEEILDECRSLINQEYKEVTLLGQNVNSYGADIVKLKTQSSNVKTTTQNLKVKINGIVVNPVMVKHLGRYRIPTLFPYLLEEVAKLGFEKVDFISSNPWDFSDELIEIIAKNTNITRKIHLPVQSGDDEILKKMNRWYSRDEYLRLIAKLKSKIEKVKITTDIIVGFCGETDEQFENTVRLCKEVGFEKAYIAMYSQRPMTTSYKTLKDDVPCKEKKRRFQVLERLINQKSS